MPTASLALSGPVVAAAGVLLAATGQPATGTLAPALVGIGTSLLTTRVFTRFVAIAPSGMLARFQSLLGLAQTASLLLATPMIGRLSHSAGAYTALTALAGVLVLSFVAAHRGETQLHKTAVSTSESRSLIGD